MRAPLPASVRRYASGPSLIALTAARAGPAASRLVSAR